MILPACESPAPVAPQATVDGDAAVLAAPDGGGSTISTIPTDGSAGPAGGATDAASLRPHDAASLPSDSGAATAGDCNARFVTATRVSIDLSWLESIAFVGQQGKAQVWSRDTYTPSAEGYTLESAACGLALPVFKGTPLLDSLQFAFDIPTATFDLPTMPRFAGRAAWRAGLLVTEPGPFIHGTTLSDPAAAWPARATGITAFDHDADGKPGITSVPRRSDTFAMPPLDIGFTTFADQVYVASRIVVRRSAARAGCSEKLEGSVEPLAFDFTLVGCHVSERDDCTERELNVISNNMPRSMLGTQSAWASVPIAETATCAEVLAALPAQ